jgi:hypothetical protein
MKIRNWLGGNRLIATYPVGSRLIANRLLGSCPPAQLPPANRIVRTRLLRSLRGGLAAISGAALVGAILTGAGGCASSYATPGRGADLSVIGVDRNTLTDSSLQSTLDKKPLAQLPAAIAVVRNESPGYQSETAQSFGNGSFSVVTTRDIEDPKVIEKWQSMPMVLGVAPINRLLLPADLKSDMDLRQAAAALHADFVLAYTIDTVFTTSDLASPLTVVSLGLAPDKKTHVISTASAVLMDTRNGYIYGVAEATDDDSGLSTSWNSDSQIDGSRRKTEAAAFSKMADQVQTMWVKVVKDYTPMKPVQ